jgi:hypothetical protein
MLYSQPYPRLIGMIPRGERHNRKSHGRTTVRDSQDNSCSGEAGAVISLIVATSGMRPYRTIPDSSACTGAYPIHPQGCWSRENGQCKQPPLIPRAAAPEATGQTPRYCVSARRAKLLAAGALRTDEAREAEEEPQHEVARNAEQMRDPELLEIGDQEIAERHRREHCSRSSSD